MDHVEKQTRQTILKFTLQDEVGAIHLPAAAKIMSTAWQDEAVQLWVLADPSLPKVKRIVLLRSTGHEVLGDNWEYAGTVLASMKRVFHVFLEIV